jgi:hypothetical protein
MNCPSCQAPLPEPAPRFCESCGLFLPRVARRATAPDGPVEVRCTSCGVVATGRRCQACGVPVRWPDGQAPPGEAEVGWTRHRRKAANGVRQAAPAPAPTPVAAAAPTPTAAPPPDPAKPGA